MKEKTTGSIQSTLLKSIDIDDDSFRLTFCPDLGGLKVSMDKVGLINPVILRGKERFQVVSGYKRVLVAQSLGWKRISARVFTPDKLDVEKGFKLNLYDNLATRTFNLIESNMAIVGFMFKCNKDSSQVREKILPLLGFHSGSKVFRELLSLTDLIAEWKESVVKKGVSLPNAAKVASFSPEEQKVLYETIYGLKLGENKLRQCLEMAEEICQRDEISFQRLFISEPFNYLNKNEKLNITERTELFRKALRDRRYPELTRQQDKFQKERKRLFLPPSVSLEPPEFFEGNKLKLTLRFRSPEELRAILDKLETASDSETLKVLLKML